MSCFLSLLPSNNKPFVASTMSSIHNLKSSSSCNHNQLDRSAKITSFPRVHATLPQQKVLGPLLAEVKTQEYMTERQTTETPRLSNMWREVHGLGNWQGLLDPLHPRLRHEIIRYGEFAQSCYDVFDYHPHSKHCGTCKYDASNFFRRLDMHYSGYEVNRFLYATYNKKLETIFRMSSIQNAWSTHSNWIGYVATCTDEQEIRRLGRRDILIAWRGTVTELEWMEDFMNMQTPAGFTRDQTVKIHSGFLDLYVQKATNLCKFCEFSAREQVLAEVKCLLEKYHNEGIETSITITGHSLGAALAVISAYDMAETKINILKNGRKIPISVFSFSGPKVGNLRFKERCEELGLRVLRVINVHDKVPTVPWNYAHVGVELPLDHKVSPFLKATNDLGCHHNLEALLHLVDGHQGKGSKKFHLENKRDVALVNKNCNFLKDEYAIPPCWRQEENKGLIRNVEGRWVMPDKQRFHSAHPEDTAYYLQQVLETTRLQDGVPQAA